MHAVPGQHAPPPGHAPHAPPAGVHAVVGWQPYCVGCPKYVGGMRTHAAPSQQVSPGLQSWKVFTHTYNKYSRGKEQQQKLATPRHRCLFQDLSNHQIKGTKHQHTVAQYIAGRNSAETWNKLKSCVHAFRCLVLDMLPAARMSLQQHLLQLAQNHATAVQLYLQRMCVVHVIRCCW